MSAVGEEKWFSREAPPVSGRSVRGWLGWRRETRREGWEVEGCVVTIAGRVFRPTTVEGEEALVRNVGSIIDSASQPVEIRSHDIGAVIRVLRKYFAIYEEGGTVTIGSNSVEEKDLGNGMTRITYANGRIKEVLQPYSAKDHPWVVGMLGEGMEIPAEALEQLEARSPENNSTSMIISLDGVTFKRGKDDVTTERRFEQRAKAKHVCHALGLDRLVIPPAIRMKFQGQPLFIAEKPLPIDLAAQEERYRACSPEVVQQLIRFIQETGLSGISWSTIPLLEDGRVALVGLDDVPNKDIGLLGAGTASERGLLGCLFLESQIDAVVQAAGGGDRAEKMKQKRLAELK